MPYARWTIARIRCPEIGGVVGEGVSNAGIAGPSARLTSRRKACRSCNTDDILDSMMDMVFAEIDLPSDGADCKTAMRDILKPLGATFPYARIDGFGSTYGVFLGGGEKVAPVSCIWRRCWRNRPYSRRYGARERGRGAR